MKLRARNAAVADVGGVDQNLAGLVDVDARVVLQLQAGIGDAGPRTTSMRSLAPMAWG